MSFEDKMHVCSDCWITARDAERERIIKLLTDYSNGETLISGVDVAIALIKGGNK